MASASSRLPVDEQLFFKLAQDKLHVPRGAAKNLCQLFNTYHQGLMYSKRSINIGGQPEKMRDVVIQDHHSFKGERDYEKLTLLFPPFIITIIHNKALINSPKNPKAD
ncbi:hypothetical protein D3C75_818460 [compost metagenome]